MVQVHGSRIIYLQASTYHLTQILVERDSPRTLIDPQTDPCCEHLYMLAQQVRLVITQANIA
jgi:hypothetical protein